MSLDALTLKVEQPGLMSLVQDVGRWGYQRFGVNVSGVRDPLAMRLANALVGNELGQAVLECNVTGPSFEVVGGSVLMALTGSAQAGLKLDSGQLIPAQQSVFLRVGERVEITPFADSACVTLAVHGGFAVPPVLGSSSTYGRGGFGGFQGRALEAGDSLPLGGSLQREERGLDLPLPYGQGLVPVVLGPQADAFSPGAVEALCSAPYRVGRESDRMGARLEGPVVEHLGDFNIVSDGMAIGAIQVPGNGQPIVMGPDRGTVGGYTKIGAVASAALPRMGRLRPGDEVQFKVVSAQEAVELARAQARDMDELLGQIRRQAAR